MRDFANVQIDPWLRERAAEVCLALALAPAFAWMNPFFSSKQVYPALFVYWAGLLASWFILMAIVERLLNALDVVRRMPPGIRRAVVIAVAALPMILIAGAATHALKGWKVTPAEIFELYVQIVLIGSGVTLIAVAAFTPWPEAPVSAQMANLAPVQRDRLQMPLPAETGHEETAPLVQGRLIARLPQPLRGQILCLQMEDHYVRVHTDRGSALVLLRMSDAIAEAAPVPGRQVHRSWWVADEAIQRFERVGRTAQIHLNLGIAVPVSQRYLKSAESVYALKGNGPEAESAGARA